jgi:hypothetical protein
MGAVTPSLSAVVIGITLLLALISVACAFALSRMAIHRDAEIDIEIRVLTIFRLVLRSRQRRIEVPEQTHRRASEHGGLGNHREVPPR